MVGRHFDMRRVWSGWCDEPRFAPIDSGHFIPEEAPDQALDALMEFLTRA